MSRKVILIGIVLLAGALFALFFIRGRIAQVSAGILIETEPTATVFLDGEQVGTTPFRAERKPSEVTVKLIPFAQGSPLVPFETKVTLVSGIETVIKRSFGPTDDESSGEVLLFEKMGGRAATVAIVSTPDAAQVSLDGKTIGFTPRKIDEAGPGQHTLRLAAEGYSPREMNIQTVAGYKLTIIAKLAKLPEVQSEQKEQVSTQQKVQLVEILTTPTGFLRVRTEPSTTATESARVTPGKRYTLLEENEDKSWYKIEYEEGKTGWISAQYTKKVEQ
ncbi:PEGA domain-containing protein [Candidatus Microgenomates bacterium]|nr:PEGA domain-containing protein [Candidatus Microgenomates bacterium]